MVCVWNEDQCQYTGINIKTFRQGYCFGFKSEHCKLGPDLSDKSPFDFIRSSTTICEKQHDSKVCSGGPQL